MKPFKFFSRALPVAAVFCIGTSHAAVFGPEELGTPSGRVSMNSFRVAPLGTLEAAMPRYDQTKLQRHLMQLAKNSEALVAARGLDSLSLSGSRATMEVDGRVEAGEALVNISGGDLRFERASNPETLSTIPLAVGHMQKAVIADQHKSLLAKYGIDSQNTQVIETNVLVQQTEALDGSGIKSEPKLQGYLSVAVRSAGELIVEDQRARLVSDRDGRIRTVNIHWPELKLSKATANGNLKSRTEVLKEIAAHMGGQLEQVDVRMAVVLRPNINAKGTTYVPAMRVGITPFNGEAGEIFYIDLSRESRSISG